MNHLLNFSLDVGSQVKDLEISMIDGISENIFLKSLEYYGRKG